MTTDQIILFTLLFFVFALLISGRLRYDLVAFMALTVALILGVIPKEQAFSGFGHPATIIIALVLVVSKGLSNSGVVELVARQVSRFAYSLQTHIAAMAGIAAALSAVMNNVAALALLMPVDVQAAIKANAAVICHHPGRFDYPDRYAAQHHYCRVSPAGAGGELLHV